VSILANCHALNVVRSKRGGKAPAHFSVAVEAAKRRPLHRWERHLHWALMHHQPAVRLWATVFSSALKELRSPSREVAEDAREWVRSTESVETVGSFAWVCAAVLDGWSANVVRQDILDDRME